jgi:hypothetical protein
MSERASVFDNSDFDLAGFAPKKIDRAKPEAPTEAIREISEASSFRSREPVQVEKKESATREPRRHRTGRNVQLNIKVRAETLNSFYDLADKQNWVLGETLEKAIAALKREITTKSERLAESN